jgi:catechol 2,3-dioxygenase-like lactoylglutathione lyase family enzyme
MTTTIPDAPGSATATNPWALKMVAPLEPGIVCFDMERMFRFYIDILGLTVVHDVEAPQHIGKAIHISPHGYRIVRLQTSYGERIKLIQSNVPPNPHPEYDYVYECQGLAYLTFIVSNMKDILPKLEQENIKLLSDGVVEVRPGVLALFIKDPEGNFVEIVDYPDIASYRPDLYSRAKTDQDWPMR